MWFYADDKNKPMSPTMTPKKLTTIGRRTPARRTPNRRTPNRRTPSRKISPRPLMTRPVIVKPGSPPPLMTRPGIVKPGSPPPRVTRPPTLKPGSPPGRPRPIPIPPIHRPGKPVSPIHFQGCDTSLKTVSIPRVKYTLHQKPVVFEKISKKVCYDKVPVSYEYEKKQHPIKVVKSPCSPCGRKPMSPLPAPACGKKDIKLPCAMQDNWHLNRPPCKNLNALGKDVWSPSLKESHLGRGGHHKWWMGKNAANSGRKLPCGVPKSPCNSIVPCAGTPSFPRWQSQYVPQGKSPCMVSTTGSCQKTRCGSC